MVHRNLRWATLGRKLGRLSGNASDGIELVQIEEFAQGAAGASIDSRCGRK